MTRSLKASLPGSGYVEKEEKKAGVRKRKKGDKLDKGRKVFELLLDRPGMKNICFSGSQGTFKKEIEKD